LCADFEPLIEQRLNCNAVDDGPERQLRCLIKVAMPTLGFVRGLYRINDLICDDQADFDADAVRRQDILGGHKERCFAEVNQAHFPAPAPEHVATSIVAPDKQAVTIHESRPTFLHAKDVVEFIQHRQRDESSNDNSRK